MNYLAQKYHSQIKQQLKEELNLKSIMQVPRLTKIVLNMTAGKEVTNSKAIEEVFEELKLISGQKPVYTYAKKSLASWKLREGMKMGAKVTLRRQRMWDFLNKLINVSLPRTRDFRGLSPKAFDCHGNYALGIKEQIIFPEISFEKIRRIRGLDVIIVTSTEKDDQARALLAKLGMPFAEMKWKEKING